MPERREQPHYAFFASILTIEKLIFGEDGAVEKVDACVLTRVMLSASQGGMAMPCPNTFTLKLDDSIRINCQVYGSLSDGTPCPAWTFEGKAVHKDHPAGYFGLKITNISDRDRSIYDEWLRTLALLEPKAQNPIHKDVLEGIGIVVNTLGVGCGIVALVWQVAQKPLLRLAFM
jgi:hypothetical protein